MDEMTALFAKGLVIGLSIAAPVGPIGVLCINRSLNHGMLAGLATGMGAAVADGLYGAVAAFGIASVSVLLIDHQDLIRLAGGGILLALGVRTFRAPLREAAAPIGAAGLLGAFASCVLLTLANPATILSFIAIFAGLGLAEQAGGYRGAWVMVLGVFLGSALWWLGLSSAVGRLGARVGPVLRRWINRISGGVLAAFGLAAVATIFWL